MAKTCCCGWHHQSRYLIHAGPGVLSLSLLPMSLCPAGSLFQQAPCSQAVLAPTSAQPPLEPLTAQHQRQGVPQQQQQQPQDSHLLNSSSSDPVPPQQQQQQLFRVSPSGLDSVTFLLAAGPSEPLRPLADVASGGEAARVMLALKAAAAAVAAPAADSSSDGSSDGGSSTPTAAAAASGSPPPVLVLDELDAGVGSRLGAPIGRLLQRLVAGSQPTASQVLVVTHTPQVRPAACT